LAYLGVNTSEDAITRFDRIYERDGRTQTPHDGIGRACIALHGKNEKLTLFSVILNQAWYVDITSLICLFGCT